MREIWKTIPGKIGYEVSNLGRVRSFYENRYLRSSPQRILKPAIGSHGYPVIGFSRGQMCLHVVVLMSFRGPAKNRHGAHNNGIKTDNRLSNLRWDTPSNNALDKRIHGTMPSGSKHYKAKLTEKTVVLLRREAALKLLSKRKLALKYGISLDACLKAIDGRTWSHVNA